MINISEKLEYHYQEALKHYPADRIIGVFLQGAQNYGVADEHSDVDTRLLVLPDFEDLILGKKPDSYTIILDNDEHIDVKDVRAYLDILKKQNLNFLEILFTPYRRINPLYEYYWDSMVISFSERIARYDKYNNMKTMAHQASQKHRDMYAMSPARGAAIEKYGYDPKSLHHLVRISEFMEAYWKDEKLYEEMLMVEDPSYHIGLKRGALSEAEAEELAVRAEDRIIELMKEVPKDYPVDKEVAALLDNAKIVLMKHYFASRYVYSDKW